MAVLCVDGVCQVDKEMANAEYNGFTDMDADTDTTQYEQQQFYLREDLPCEQQQYEDLGEEQPEEHRLAAGPPGAPGAGTEGARLGTAEVSSPKKVRTAVCANGSLGPATCPTILNLYPTT